MLQRIRVLPIIWAAATAMLASTLLYVGWALIAPMQPCYRGDGIVPLALCTARSPAVVTVVVAVLGAYIGWLFGQRLARRRGIRDPRSGVGAIVLFLGAMLLRFAGEDVLLLLGVLMILGGCVSAMLLQLGSRHPTRA